MKQKKSNDLTQLAINTIRFLAVDAVEKANSGHPGTPMGMAAPAFVLWSKFLKHNPKNPAWANRDRFVLSAGHGSMLLYALLHLTGYDVTLEDLKNFRQWGSRTPGHPEYGETPGVETTTGPLGQGFATAVGMAIAQRYLNSLFTPKSAPLFDYKIYGIAGDGDMMEGLSHEAASLAGHLGLGSLKFIYDSNHISIDGHTNLAYSDNVAMLFRAYNWHVLTVSDANDTATVEKALKKANENNEKPTLIIVKSIIGYGSPNKGDTAEAHGAALGAEEVKKTKEHLGWPLEPTFLIPDKVKSFFAKALERGVKLEETWKKRLDTWKRANPEGSLLYERLKAGALPDGWETQLPDFSGQDKLATRVASGAVLHALSIILPELFGGSADLSASNNTLLKDVPSFSKEVPGRNLHFGVREHAMAAALNGMALSNMIIPYGGTFLVFSDYMKGAMRISALLKKRVVYILTHDSLGVGEDGPTHQPIEQVVMLRSLPNMTVIRPADATETGAAWKWALKHKTGPVSLILTRQAVPVLKKDVYPEAGSVEKGAYVLSESPSGRLDMILIATGSEVSLALSAQKKLLEENIHARVVSMPSWDIFDRQTDEYKGGVLPPQVKARLAVEALSPMGWERYVGCEGAVIGIATFGASAPGPIVMEKFGFNVSNVVTKAKMLLAKNKEA